MWCVCLANYHYDSLTDNRYVSFTHDVPVCLSRALLAFSYETGIHGTISEYNFVFEEGCVPTTFSINSTVFPRKCHADILWGSLLWEGRRCMLLLRTTCMSLLYIMSLLRYRFASLVDLVYYLVPGKHDRCVWCLTGMSLLCTTGVSLLCTRPVLRSHRVSYSPCIVCTVYIWCAHNNLWPKSSPWERFQLLWSGRIPQDKINTK